ncbi:hypothetical protein A2U01_0087739 [Trifolium medium]|uniref:Uncharacterized protein n=1 Tax=Trifolium medium TaxID=97028 RepID=A0A392TZ93_9FABA|nr:hypothetical protein [Trifolium medium]
MKMKRKKRLQLDAVLKWIHNRPIKMVPDRGSGPEEDSRRSNYGNPCCRREHGYITEDEPKRTYPLE